MHSKLCSKGDTGNVLFVTVTPHKCNFTLVLGLSLENNKKRTNPELNIKFDDTHLNV